MGIKMVVCHLLIFIALGDIILTNPILVAKAGGRQYTEWDAFLMIFLCVGTGLAYLS